jgi:hypothetical protein
MRPDMICKFVRYLLIVLLLSGLTDDLWASGTADPFDDVLALENNEYPLVVLAHPYRRLPGHEVPPPAAFHTPAVRSFLSAPAWDRHADADGPFPGSPQAQYALMSLQR